MEKKLEITILHNVRFDGENFFKGYQIGDPLVLKWQETWNEDTDHEKILERIFTKHNLVNRPNGMGMRSLSVGDVVIIKAVGKLSTPECYCCGVVGWEKVSNAQVFSSLIYHRTWEEKRPWSGDI